MLETATFTGFGAVRNPYVLMEHVCHSMSEQTVGHSFHESTVTIAVNLDILENFMFPRIVDKFDGLIFQQVNSPDNFLVDGSSGGRLIDQPPQSIHLTPMDFFLWGYIKAITYSKMVPIAVAERSRARTVFARSNTAIVGSNLT
jgi:hypothetical protein